MKKLVIFKERVFHIII